MKLFPKPMRIYLEINENPTNLRLDDFCALKPKTYAYILKPKQKKIATKIKGTPNNIRVGENDYPLFNIKFKRN